MKAAGVNEHKVYADIAESMDTIFHEMEVDSLDEYFEMERSFFVDMDAETKGLVDAYNDVTVAGRREIFEVLDISWSEAGEEW